MKGSGIGHIHMEEEATDLGPDGKTKSPGRADFGPEARPDADGEHPVNDAFRRLKKYLDELKEEISFYLAARSDALKFTLKKVGIYAGLGVVGLIAAAAIVVTACVLL